MNNTSQQQDAHHLLCMYTIAATQMLTNHLEDLAAMTRSPKLLVLPAGNTKPSTIIVTNIMDGVSYIERNIRHSLGIFGDYNANTNEGNLGNLIRTEWATLECLDGEEEEEDPPPTTSDIKECHQLEITITPLYVQSVHAFHHHNNDDDNTDGANQLSLSHALANINAFRERELSVPRNVEWFMGRSKATQTRNIIASIYNTLDDVIPSIRDKTSNPNLRILSKLDHYSDENLSTKKTQAIRIVMDGLESKIKDVKDSIFRALGATKDQDGVRLICQRDTSPKKDVDHEVTGQDTVKLIIEITGRTLDDIGKYHKNTIQKSLKLSKQYCMFALSNGSIVEAQEHLAEFLWNLENNKDENKSKENGKKEKEGTPTISNKDFITLGLFMILISVLLMALINS
jgi:hypothetical protein